MRPVHYIATLVAAALVVALYFGGNTIPPKKNGAPVAAASGSTPHNTARPASFDSLLTAARKDLPSHAVSEISTIEKQITAIGDSTRMAVLFDTLATHWREHRQFPVAAYYYLLAGKLENSSKKLTFAAQLFLDLARKTNDQGMQLWLAGNAIEGFNRAVQLEPNNDTLKISLAECYIGTGETMNGVTLLRDVTTKNPDNVPANLMLGQQGIVSGQYDKAVGRFEKVLKADPDNVEAMLGLAEVYRNTGAKEKAVAQLQTAKKVMNNPEFSNDIDEYINTIK